LRQAKAAVISNNEVMPGVHLIWLDSPQIASQAKPGQFVMVRCGENTVLRRPMSIHQLDGKRLALLVNIVGKGTQWLAQCQAGDNIDLLGPLGNGYSIHPDSRNLLLVAGGIGTAPLVFLAQQALSQKCSVTVLLGAATATQLYPKNLLPAKAKLIIVTEDGSMGKRGLVTDLLPDFTGGADQIFACGPMPMYKAMAQMPELKNKPVQISLEVRMGCGLSVCYGCTLKTNSGLRQVCKDGPVFDLDDILWGELRGVEEGR
jgi:dihydroorotate dehydrogenase electron transfer subunit